MSNIETLEENLQEESKELRQLKVKAENAWEDLVDLIRRHPAAALGITLAAGVAVGSLAARGRSTSASEKIRDLAGTGADAWSRVSSGFEDAVGTLKDAINDAMRKFR